MSASNIVNMPKRFDYSSSADFNMQFTQALSHMSAANKTVLLDCSIMDYIDSAGIGLLVMTHKRAQSSHAHISIINLKPSAREILLLANLQKLIDIK